MQRFVRVYVLDDLTTSVHTPRMDLSGKKVAITGAGGFIGRHLVRRLSEEGAHVTGIDLKGVKPETGKRVQWIESDLSDEAALKKQLSDCDLVYHLAFPVSDWEKEEVFVAALKASDLICKICSQKGIRLVLTTSVVVYGDMIGKGPIDESTAHGKPTGFYTEYKQKQEENAIGHMHRSGADIRIVRPANVYGAGSKPWVNEVVKVLRQGLPALIGDGKGRAGLIHVLNLVEILILVARDDDSKGEIFLASDDNHVAWHTYFSDLAHLANANAPGSMPRFASEMLAVAGETAWKTFGLKGRPPLTRQALMLIGADNDFMNTKVKEKLGFAPVITYTQAMAEIGDYLKTTDL